MKKFALSLMAGVCCLVGAGNANAGLFGGSCGCEPACEPVCCEVSCCEPVRCRPALGGRIRHLFHNHGCCAVETCCDAAPSCGCDPCADACCRKPFGSRLRGLVSRCKPACCEVEVCCDAAPSCGCDAAPSCCDPCARPAFGSRLRGLMNRCKPACCEVECGCAVEASCGCGG